MKLSLLKDAAGRRAYAPLRVVLADPGQVS